VNESAGCRVIPPQTLTLRASQNLDKNQGANGDGSGKILKILRNREKRTTGPVEGRLLKSTDVFDEGIQKSELNFRISNFRFLRVTL
jgi:hypothetical protein